MKRYVNDLVVTSNEVVYTLEFIQFNPNGKTNY